VCNETKNEIIVERQTLAKSQDYYNNRGRKKEVGGEPGVYYDWIVRLLEIKGSCAKFLDVGCGGGSLLDSVGKKQGLKAFGIDLSHECLKIARQNNPFAGLAVSIGEKLPFKDNTFDYIACSGVLEHFFSPNLGVREMRRLLKYGGRIIIMVPNKFQIKEIAKVFKTGYGDVTTQPIEKSLAKNEWKALFLSEGLKVKRIYKYNGFYPFVEKGSFKIKSLKKYLLSLINRYLVPFNLSYSFVYVCTK
jgi:SAM-dependent methyltransferase